MSRLVALTVLASICVTLGKLNPPSSLSGHHSRSTLNKTFSWTTLGASKTLKWQDCLPGRQCARLIVPLNHSDPHAGEATIALIRVPSSVSHNSPSYRGPVLFNPGGPGGSGIDMIGGPDGDSYSVILGPQFDIVGFDPRGVGHSTPHISFFKTGVERAIWTATQIPVLKDVDDVEFTWARNKIAGQLAEENNSGFLRYMNTEQTARDMLAIVKAHKREKLQYWGFSYGTILGVAFAALFPDKIERMVIDGVVDADDYYSTLWKSNTKDTDKTLDAFFTGCFEAGPEKCPFYAPSPDAIRQNLTNLYEKIRSKPIPVKTASSYGVFDYTSLRVAVFNSFYSSNTGFPPLAQGLSDLAAGNGTTLFEMVNPPGLRFQCDTNPEDHLGDAAADAQIAILCNDGDDVQGDLDSAIEFYKEWIKESDWADLWSVRLYCTGWPKVPKGFKGPFKANTSHPILLIGNTADPLTPLAGAIKMSLGFDGSVVLTQDSAGHTSVSTPSSCTNRYVRKYFVNGTLPDRGTICQPDAKPFQISINGSLGTANEQTVEDGDLVRTPENFSKMHLFKRFRV